VTTHNGRQSPLTAADAEQLRAGLAAHPLRVKPKGRSDVQSSGVPMEEDRLKNWFGGVSTCRLPNAPATGWWARDGAAVDRAIAKFAESYAEVNEEDHRSSGEAVRFGRVLAQADRERGTRPVLRLLPDGPAGRSSGNSRTRSTAP
jgi:hypothetical protein